MIKAMILCAGFGKRLNPLTLKLPKPLLKIGKETLLSNTIKFLENYGIQEVIINVHYLGSQIIEYTKNNKFNLNITIIEEKEKILDTGGGVLNAIDYFSKEHFLIINPDTIWNATYYKYLRLMQKNIVSIKNSKCFMLLVNKKKSFDKSLLGDFNLEKNLIKRDGKKDNSEYIYTGLQIIKPEVFLEQNNKIFSMNKVWNNLINKKQLLGVESKNEFFHVSDLNTYKSLISKNLDIK